MPQDPKKPVADIVDVSKLPPPPGMMTQEEVRIVGQALYAPTIERMRILLESLVTQTQTADYAFWAPCAVIEQLLSKTLTFDNNREASLALLAVMAEALDILTQRITAYRTMARMELGAGRRFPEYGPFCFSDADTRTCYETAERLMAAEAEADQIAAAAQQEPPTP